jgi:hypothetical protein
MSYVLFQKGIFQQSNPPLTFWHLDFQQSERFLILLNVKFA